MQQVVLGVPAEGAGQGQLGQRAGGTGPDAGDVEPPLPHGHQPGAVVEAGPFGVRRVGCPQCGQVVPWHVAVLRAHPARRVYDGLARRGERRHAEPPAVGRGSETHGQRRRTHHRERRREGHVRAADGPRPDQADGAQQEFEEPRTGEHGRVAHPVFVDQPGVRRDPRQEGVALVGLRGDGLDHDTCGALLLRARSGAL